MFPVLVNRVQTNFRRFCLTQRKPIRGKPAALLSEDRSNRLFFLVKSRKIEPGERIPRLVIFHNPRIEGLTAIPAENRMSDAMEVDPNGVDAHGEIGYRRFLHSDKQSIKAFYRKCGVNAVIGTEATTGNFAC